MTGYILGDVYPRISAVNRETSTFVPLYSHYYEERIPDICVEKEFVRDDGTVVMRKFDLVRQIFVD